MLRILGGFACCFSEEFTVMLSRLTISRLFRLSICIGALVMALAGCSPPDPAAGKIKLVVWGLEAGQETAGQDARIREFERRHPNIKVSTLSMGAGAMNPQKLMTAIVGAVPPDVIRQDRFTVGDWASRGAFRPLDDRLAADAHSSDPLAVRQKDYVPAT